MSWIASLREAVGEGISEFTASALKEAQETVKDSLTEGQSIVKGVAVNVKGINTAIRNSAAQHPHDGADPPAVGNTATKATSAHAQQPPVQRSSSSLQQHMQDDNHDAILKEYISESKRQHADVDPHSPVDVAPRASSTTTDGRWHTPTTVGLVTPLRPGNAAADTLRGGTRSHRDLSQSMQRSRNHHNAASGHHRHHQPHSATIREHADTIASTTSTGSAPPHQRRLESTRSRSSQRKHAGGSNTPTGATSTTATLSRASSRSIRGDDLDAHQAAATPTGGKGGGIDVQRGDDGDVPQGEAFEELVLSESPPAVDVHVSAVPRHQRSLSAGTAWDMQQYLPPLPHTTATTPVTPPPPLDTASHQQQQQRTAALQAQVRQLQQQVVSMQQDALVSASKLVEVGRHAEEYKRRGDDAVAAIAQQAAEFDHQRASWATTQQQLEEKLHDATTQLNTIQHTPSRKQHDGDDNDAAQQRHGGDRVHKQNTNQGKRKGNKTAKTDTKQDQKQHDDSQPNNNNKKADEELGQKDEEIKKLRAQVATLQAAAAAQDKEVAELAASLEERLTEATTQRDAAVQECGVAEEKRRAAEEKKRAAEEALKEVNVLLNQSVAERTRMAEELSAFEPQLQHSRDQMQQLGATVERQKREAADLLMQLAHVKEQQQLMQQDATHQDQRERDALQARLDTLREELVTAHQAMHDAQATAAQAEQRVQQAEEQARVARLERDQAITQAQEAAAMAAAEAAAREHAQSSSSTLKAESDRRAALFHTAVTTAVARAEAQLRVEIDTLTVQLEQTQSGLVAAQEALGLAVQQGETATARAESAEAAVRKTTAQRDEAVAQCEALQAQVGTLEQELSETRNALETAQAATAAALVHMEEAEKARGRMEAEVQGCKQRVVRAEKHAELMGERVVELETAVGHWKERAQLEADSAAAAISRAQAQDAAAAEARQQARAAREEAAVLEGQLHQRSARPSVLPKKEDILSSLGLDKLGLGQVATGGGDVEMGASKRDGLMAHASRKGMDATAMIKGVVGLRTWIVVGYIALLHFVVMLQFHNRHVDLEVACAHVHPLP